jgi:hypothetical protein
MMLVHIDESLLMSWLTHDWYILGTWLDALVYGTG